MMSEQMPSVSAINPRPKSGRFLLLLLVFGVGLLVGWLVIGWMLWPVQWIDALPSNLRLDDQRQFVTLVAGEYAQTGDAALAQERLASWDEESLATLLAMMEQQATDDAALAALSGLREALSVPQTAFSFWDVILGQKLVVISAALGGLVLLTAVALTIYPSIRRTQARQARRKQLEAEEEALFMAAAAEPTAAVETVGVDAETAVPSPAEPSQTQTAAEETPQAEPQAPQNQPAQQEPQPAGQPQAAAPTGEAQTTPAQPQPSDPAAKPDEAPAAEKPETQTPAPAARPPPTPAQPLIEEEEEEEAAADDSIQSILSSVFEDDDDSAHLESLLKGLDDINIMKLVQSVEQTAKQLRARRQREKTAASTQSILSKAEVLSAGVAPPTRTIT